MTNSHGTSDVDGRSGLPLLLTYTILVTAFATLAIMTLSFLKLGDIVFIVMLAASIIPTWPLAVWIENKIAAKPLLRAA